MTPGRPPDNPSERAPGGRFTIRNVGGVALATAGLDTSGVWWGTTEVGALVTVAGFTIATWALFTRRHWWAGAALASATLGTLVLVPYWVAAHAAGETTPWFNVLIHLLGCAGVFLLLLTPRLRAWVDRHVTAGR
ncbi:MAG: hypothetical protein K0S40_2486 [Actinomycetospora sp.]|nr:hypothetical protein [Actinomycetospora sp.]